LNIIRNQINLFPLGKDKDILVKSFSADENLVSLLMPNYNPSTATEDLDIILKDHIYKTISIDNTEGESRAYICIDTYVPTIEGDFIKEIGIVINVFCHRSLIDLSSAENNKFVKLGLFGNRIDMLVDCIDRILNGKTGIGIGKVRLRPRNPIGIYTPTNGYYGKSMEYVVTDFNNLPAS
jgi:hypothetical protein